MDSLKTLIESLKTSLGDKIDELKSDLVELKQDQKEAKEKIYKILFGDGESVGILVEIDRLKRINLILVWLCSIVGTSLIGLLVEKIVDLMSKH